MEHQRSDTRDSISRGKWLARVQDLVKERGVCGSTVT
ncbi:hypothetical protein PR003_g30111 [Phytophthora rubi]|uniref:Uncharacterized protein n=1 Tax=Phytophthora rubi TaxID=129364 RepID=A0A6A4BEI0_9STRA|nr:hypothetical protein PR003_g30111 [Phytophthora rubi]